MKKTQTGSVVPALLFIIALLIIGGGYYVISSKKSVSQNPTTNTDTNTNTNTGSNTAANPTMKTYSDNKISFDYPGVLTARTVGPTIELSHAIDYKHTNPCDFKGDQAPLNTLQDFKVTINVLNESVMSYVQRSQSLEWSDVSKNPYSSGKLSGYHINSSVEGCGVDIFFFNISENKSLVISRYLVTEFNPIISDYKKNLQLPGIIPPTKADEYFNQILLSIKVK